MADCLRQNETDTGGATSHSRRFAGLNLTPRQFDVLRLVALSRSNKAIADELGIGLRTVKGHMAVILRALHVDNRRDAGRHARRWLARNDDARGTLPGTRARVPAFAKAQYGHPLAIR